MEFHERLKELRMKSGMSQKDIAEAIGVAKSTYSLYESGKREPDVLKIKSIIKLLNADSNYLLGIDVHKEQDEGIIMYNQLDRDDTLYIQGEMKAMLRNPKYTSEDAKQHPPDSVQDTATSKQLQQDITQEIADAVKKSTNRV